LPHHLERQLRGRHGDRARALFTLVAPLVDVAALAMPATDMRTTDTEQLSLFSSGAVSPLYRADAARRVDVASANDGAAPWRSQLRLDAELQRRQPELQQQGQQLSRSSRPQREGDGISYSELLAADLDCRRAKRSSLEARAWEANQADNLAELHEDLNSGAYKPGPSIVFAITRPKRREVIAALYRDRVVHHAVYNKIGPRFERRFIADSCACIEGRGTHYAARRLETKVRSLTRNWTRPGFYLKVDVQSFFPSIDKRKLVALIEPHVHETFWRELIVRILLHDPRQDIVRRGDLRELALVAPAKSLFSRPAHLGLAIGNLLSQFSANVYLDRLDQHAKHQLRIRHYIRYVDDVVVLHENATQLNAWRSEIDSFLQGELGLRLNPSKTVIQPIERGIDFVGQVLKPHRRTLRRRTFNSALYRLEAMPAEDIPESATSYLGLLRQCTHSHHDRARVANVCRLRGFSVDHELTKVYP
jgi:RNA-directed DNA polymerase